QRPGGREGGAPVGHRLAPEGQSAAADQQVRQRDLRCAGPPPGTGDPVTKPVRVSVFGKTDLGRSRDHNEDTFLVADLSTKNASLLPEVREHTVGPRGSLFMVADGMGGAAAGEVASAMAAELIYKHLSTQWAADKETSAQRFAFRMKEAVEVANGGINAYT